MLTAGCSTVKTLAPEVTHFTSENKLPIKIGILGDSQITSQNGQFNKGMRSNFSDTMVNVAVRVPALEYLAPKLLEISLEKLALKVDLILYLGDGGNSGGTDEIKKLFVIFDQFRSKHPLIPLYIVIGNHDYLGAGNTTNLNSRCVLLNSDCSDLNNLSNPPLSKLEVLEKISVFNSLNPTIQGLTTSYIDNIAIMKSQFSGNRRDDHNGLYLAGLLSFKDRRNNLTEIFLSDSSDYKNLWFHAEVFGKEAYGLKGSISFSDETDQVPYLKNISKNGAIRIIASHYQPSDFNATFPFNGMSRVQRNLSHWLGNGDNYWLSAHTHNNSITLSEVGVGGFFTEGFFNGVNVGSTTDFVPHVAILEACNGCLPQRVNVKKIVLCDDESYIELLKEDIRNIGIYDVSMKAAEKFGATILGLNGKHNNLKFKKKNLWKKEDSINAVNNLKKYITLRKNRFPLESETKLNACLGHIAAQYEEKDKKAL